MEFILQKKRTADYADFADEVFGLPMFRRQHDPFVFETHRAEVDEHSFRVPSGFEVVDHLRAIDVRELLLRLHLDDHIAKADEVGLVRAVELHALVNDRAVYFATHVNSAQPQLNLKSLLVRRLEKAASELIVNIEAGANDHIRLLIARLARHLRHRSSALSHLRNLRNPAVP
jgi:hypothetical protein